MYIEWTIFSLKGIKSCTFYKIDKSRIYYAMCNKARHKRPTITCFCMFEVSRTASFREKYHGCQRQEGGEYGELSFNG
jgi:hypothetical protein